MPEFVNHTPFPNFRYYSKGADGAEFGVVIVKGTFEIEPDEAGGGRLVRSEEQAPLMFTDACHGEVNVSSLWHPSDLVPHKPKTDVVVNAVAHAPGSEPTPSWACGVRVTGTDGVRLQKSLRVTGPRSWVPRWTREPTERELIEWAETGAWREHRSRFGGWELCDPEPITSLSLRYEYAFGGEIEIGRDENGEPMHETSHHNPIGRGLIDCEATSPLAPVPAPQIEALDQPITDPFARPHPQSLGAIPPAWLPRRPLAGTYDQDWLDNRWPEWPADYDFAYHQSAHPDMIVDGYLGGDETVELRGLSRAGNVAFALPGLMPKVLFTDGAGRSERTPLDLDTVLIDATEPDPAEWRVFVSWRCRFEAGRWERAFVFDQRRDEARDRTFGTTTEPSDVPEPDDVPEPVA